MEHDPKLKRYVVVVGQPKMDFFKNRNPDLNNVGRPCIKLGGSIHAYNAWIEAERVKESFNQSNRAWNYEVFDNSPPIPGVQLAESLNEVASNQGKISSAINDSICGTCQKQVSKTEHSCWWCGNKL